MESLYYQKVIAQNNEPAIEPAMEVTTSPFPAVDSNEKPFDINSGHSLGQTSRSAIQPLNASSLKQPQ